MAGMKGYVFRSGRPRGAGKATPPREGIGIQVHPVHLTSFIYEVCCEQKCHVQAQKPKLYSLLYS